MGKFWIFLKLNRGLMFLLNKADFFIVIILLFIWKIEEFDKLLLLKR